LILELTLLLAFVLVAPYVGSVGDEEALSITTQVIILIGIILTIVISIVIMLVDLCAKKKEPDEENMMTDIDTTSNTIVPMTDPKAAQSAMMKPDPIIIATEFTPVS
jgi:hypothetical protein